MEKVWIKRERESFRCALEIAAIKGSFVRTEQFRYKPDLFLYEETKLFPDAYFRFKHYDKTHSLFLTADRAAESFKRIKKLIENYLEYGISGEFEKQFGSRYFRLLIICRGKTKSCRRFVKSKKRGKDQRNSTGQALLCNISGMKGVLLVSTEGVIYVSARGISLSAFLC